MYIYIYTYPYIYIYIVIYIERCIYIYIYREREREICGIALLIAYTAYPRACFGCQSVWRFRTSLRPQHSDGAKHALTSMCTDE